MVYPERCARQMRHLMRFKAGLERWSGCNPDRYRFDDRAYGGLWPDR